MSSSWWRRRRRQKQRFLKLNYLPSVSVCLSSRLVYSKTVLYSPLRSLLSLLLCVFWNFALIPMYWENEAPLPSLHWECYYSDTTVHYTCTKWQVQSVIVHFQPVLLVAKLSFCSFILIPCAYVCPCLNPVQTPHLQLVYQVLWLDVILLRWLGQLLRPCLKLFRTTVCTFRGVVVASTQCIHRIPWSNCKAWYLMQSTTCLWQESTRVGVQVHLLHHLHLFCKVTEQSWTVCSWALSLTVCSVLSSCNSCSIHSPPYFAL